MLRSKKAINIFFILIISILCINFSFAQSKDKEEVTFFKEGKKLLTNKCYNLALPYFLALQKEHPNNSNINYCVGICYYHISSMYDSCIYYLTLATKDVTRYYQNQYISTKAPFDVYHYLGLTYLRNNMNETAIRHFKRFQHFLDPEVKKHQLLNADINRQIIVCEQEKVYAELQRQRRSYVNDSIKNNMEFYKINYEGTAELLDEKINEVNQLQKEIESLKSSQNKSIGSADKSIPIIEQQFIVHIISSDKAITDGSLDKIQDLRQCRTADGTFHYFIGDFASRTEADKKCLEISNQGFPKAWVRLALTCK